MSPVTRPLAHRRFDLGTFALAIAMALVVLAAVSALTGPSPAAASGIVVTTEQIDEPGPLGSVSIIGDSVLIGASWEPSVSTRLAELGWGPIRFRASGGGSTGFHLDDAHPASLRNWIRWWREDGWDASTVIVNLGANDAGICSGNSSRCRQAIEHLLDLIGPDRTVVWNRITHLYSSHQQAWNDALDAAAADHPQLVLWDWPAAQVAHGIRLSGDRIHLADRAANQKRSEVMATEITELLTGARSVEATPVTWPETISGPTAARLVPVDTVRLLDTRRTSSFVDANRTVTVELAPAVPAVATAVALGITATQATGTGHVTVWPCGTPAPETSVLNVTAGRDRAAQAVVGVGTTQGRASICLRSSIATHLLVDLQGAFAPGSEGAGLIPTTPRRVLDTRATGRAATLDFRAPRGARAVAVTLTVVGARDSGYLSATPCETEPTTSVLNHGPGETVAAAAYVPVGPSGTICVTTSTSADVLVDLTGSFHPGPDGLGLITSVPRRVLDTRNGIGGWRGIQGRDQTLEVLAAPVRAEAITGTITLVGPATEGFATAAACGTSTDTSSVNGTRGSVLAAGITLGVNAQGRLCVRTSTPSHTLVDVTGWWVRSAPV